MPALRRELRQQQQDGSGCVASAAMRAEDVVTDIDFAWGEPVRTRVIVHPADDGFIDKNARRGTGLVRSGAEPTRPFLIPSGNQNGGVSRMRWSNRDYAVGKQPLLAHRFPLVVAQFTCRASASCLPTQQSQNPAPHETAAGKGGCPTSSGLPGLVRATSRVFPSFRALAAMGAA
jgi:hypothetical protein